MESSQIDSDRRRKMLIRLIHQVIAIDVASLLQLLTASLFQNHLYQLPVSLQEQIAAHDHPSNVYQLGIRCIPDEEFSLSHEVMGKALRTSRLAVMLYRQAMREEQNRPKERNVSWDDIDSWLTFAGRLTTKAKTMEEPGFEVTSRYANLD